ncbi:MAG: hypothetical protein ACOY3X_04730 [Pseudomonadota bacterium]
MKTEMHQSFLRYRNALWLKVAIAVSLLALLAYLWHRPGEPPNGGTWLGYTLGTLSALLVLWLTAYGLRRRAYRSRMGTVQGWLSAHVYLGGALLVLATLHTGFQFGLNVHTLAWVLMVLVIASGIYGTVAYRRYPRRITVNRDNRDRTLLLQEIATLDKRCEELAESLGEPIATLVASATELLQLGGSPLQQLLARDSSRMLEPVGDNESWRRTANHHQSRLLFLLAGELSRCRDPEQAARLQELIDQVGHKRQLIRRLLADIRMQGLLEIWLYLHVPLTVALLAALLAHVVSVFVYW